MACQIGHGVARVAAVVEDRQAVKAGPNASPSAVPCATMVVVRAAREQAVVFSLRIATALFIEWDIERALMTVYRWSLAMATATPPAAIRNQASMPRACHRIPGAQNGQPRAVLTPRRSWLIAAPIG